MAFPTQQPGPAMTARDLGKDTETQRLEELGPSFHN